MNIANIHKLNKPKFILSWPQHCTICLRPCFMFFCGRDQACKKSTTMVYHPILFYTVCFHEMKLLVILFYCNIVTIVFHVIDTCFNPILATFIDLSSFCLTLFNIYVPRLSFNVFRCLSDFVIFKIFEIFVKLAAKLWSLVEFWI